VVRESISGARRPWLSSWSGPLPELYEGSHFPFDGELFSSFLHVTAATPPELVRRVICR